MEAMRYTFEDGRRVLTVVEHAETNDLGEYRLFWMQPGQYVVRAIPTPSSSLNGLRVATRATAALAAIQMIHDESASSLSGGMLGTLAGAPDSDETYVPVYYPGSTDPATAAPIDLGPGANYTGVDLMVVETRTVSVRGRVINGADAGASATKILEDGAELRRITGVSVTLLPRESIVGGPQRGLSATVSETGEFEVRGVTPGSYDLIASLGIQTFVSVGANEPASVFFVMSTLRRELGGLPDDSRSGQVGGVVRIDVGNADVENITVALQAGVDITGRLSIDRGPLAEGDADLGRIRVFLRPDPLIPAADPGSFPEPTRTEGSPLAESYLLSTAWRLRDCPRITMFGRLVSEKPTSSIPCFVLTVRPEGCWRLISGRTPGPSRPSYATSVRASFPGCGWFWSQIRHGACGPTCFEPPRRMRTAGFAWEGVPPGDYTLFAWEEVEEGAWQDPNFLSIYQPLGRAIRIGENGRENVELRLIPFR